MTMHKQGTGMPSASPIPQVSIASQPAPGKRGPIGTAPRNNNSTVHTGAPEPSPVGQDAKVVPPNTAGMLPARSALPPPQVPQIKVSEVHMGSKVARPTVQEMIKAAMAGAVGRQELSREAARQAENLGEKVASEMCKECKKEPCECKEKKASYDEVLKLADAVEFIADEIKKEASIHLPGKVGTGNIEPGKGPGALHVMESPGGASLPDHKGQAHKTVPMSTPLQTSGHGPTTQMQNDMDHRPGGSQHQQTSMKGGSKTASSIRDAIKKVASEKEEKKETEGMAEAKAGLEKAEKAHEDEKKASATVTGIRSAMKKVAEDAINPAHISAGKDVGPDTRESGQSGGASPHGASMVASNESVKNLTRREAKAEPKADMKAYVDEPALSSSTDSVLQAAFSHTGEAGAKVASAMPGAVKTAAAKALLNRIKEAQQS